MLTLYGLSYWMGVCAKIHLSPWSFLPWRQTSLSDLLVLRMMFNSPICLPYMWYQNCRHAALFGANQSLTRRARSPGERCEASMKIYVPNTMKTLPLFTGNVSSTYVWNEFPNCFIIMLDWLNYVIPGFTVRFKKLETLWFDSDRSIVYWPVTLKVARCEDASKLQTYCVAVCGLVFWHLSGVFLATQRSTNISGVHIFLGFTVTIR